MGPFKCATCDDVTVKFSSVHLEEKENADARSRCLSQEECHAKTSVDQGRYLLLFVSEMIVKSVEYVCGFWGLQVARHPFLAVMGSLLLVTFLGSGLARLNLVFRPYDLWVPQESEFIQVTDWKMKNFPRLYREQMAIWEAENVLSASAVREMWKFHSEVERVSARLGNRTVTWQDVCVQIPTDEEASEDALSCYETSLLEIWGYDAAVFDNLNDAGVIEALNSVNVSRVYGSPTNFSFYLGGVTKDERGNIVRARTAIHTWLTNIDEGGIRMGEYEVDVATGEKVDLAGMAWEKALVHLADGWNGKDLRINLRAGHTLGYVLHSSITQDAVWIGVGWTILLIYVLLTLGKPLHEDQRMIPACVGLLAIGMAVLSSYGACSMIGIPYGTLNNVLPVLLVALGVDDMYVIVTAWDGCKHADGVERRAQLAMKKAGMAITVTSVTDILAFLVGTTTALPGLRWFCIYSAVGISVVYFLQGTLFVAAMVVNQRWIDSKKRKGCYSISARKWKFKFGIEWCMGLWGRCLTRPTTKAIVFVVTFVMFVYSMFNTTLLSREFDTMWLIPESSALHKWFHTVENKFPQINERGVVFFKGAKFPEDLSKLKRLSEDLRNLPEVFDVEAWFNEIDLEDLLDRHLWLQHISPLKQCKLLLHYMDISRRRHFRVDFDLEDDYEDYDYEDDYEDEAYAEHPCSTFQIEFQYLPPKTFESRQASMRRIRKLVSDAQISGYKAVWAHVYSQWETDSIILEDLFKSLCIVLSAVGVISLILLASVRASLFVLLCVVATLINVASCVHLWGLTVNTVTGIAFVLAVGICVDYAAHIAHDFLGTSGTKAERMVGALDHMGSAVFHGGSSTFITFLLLAPSDSYIYVSYFKILTSVSFFGLYHALVFLPVLLSLFGPDPIPGRLLDPFTSPPPDEDVESGPRRCPGASVYATDLPHPFNPSPYILSRTVCPPLYRKSSSLPSLAVFLSERGASGDTQTPSNSSSSSSERSFRHSTCCTKL